MHIIIDTAERIAKLAAAQFIRLIRQKPDAVLGLATGSTPLGLYAELIRAYRAGEISFAEAASFNLDEYAGLPPAHEQSYHAFMRKNLFDHIDLPNERMHIPSGVDHSAERLSGYDRAIAACGGIDLQLLGLGRNGHIGFNEPGTPFETTTHLVRLSEDTRRANARFFANEAEVPGQAVTMGIKTVMNAKSIVLVAFGAEKAEAVERALHGPVTPDMPASVLQLHPFVSVYLDQEAASKL
jgi:glucosamine-6-phosphate deaminase